MQQNTLFTKEELGPRQWSMTVAPRRQRTEKSPQDGLISQSIEIEDLNGRPVQIGTEIGDDRTWIVWNLATGRRAGELTAWRLRHHSYLEDGVHYLIRPWDQRGVRLSPEHLYQVVENFWPEHSESIKFAVGTDEHIFLSQFGDRVQSLAWRSKELEELGRQLRHPSRSKKYKELERIVEYYRNQLKKLAGLDETGLDLAVSLHRAGLSARDIYEGVAAIAG